MERERFLEIAAGPWNTTVTGEYLGWGSAPDHPEFKAAADAYFNRDTGTDWDMHPDEAAVALRGLHKREPTWLEVYSAVFSSRVRDEWWRIDPEVFDANGIPTTDAWTSWGFMAGQPSLYYRYLSAVRWHTTHPTAAAVADGKRKDPNPAETAATLRKWEAGIEARTGVEQPVTPVFPLIGAPPVLPPATPPTPTPTPPAPPVKPKPIARPKIPAAVMLLLTNGHKWTKPGRLKAALDSAKEWLLTVADE